MKLDRQAIEEDSGSMGFFKPMWLKILIVVILVLIVGSTAAYLLEIRQNQANPFSQPAPSSQAPTGTRFSPTVAQSSATPLPSSGRTAVTASWKTYTNITYGYSIQYPPQYSIRIRDGLSYGASSTIELSSPSNFDITIAVARNTNNLSLDNPRGLFGSGPLENYNLPPDIEVKQAFLGGIRAFRLDHCCGGYDGVEAEIKALKDGKVYDVVVTPDSRGYQGTKYSDDLKNPDKESVVEEIVSTFTFIQR